ncbi:MAG: hypothetical protein ACE3JP_05960 [Ectobacillus sp.]
MKLSFIQRKYLKYNKGTGLLRCHADALHAAPPMADLMTDKIVEALIAQIGCAGIISTVSRTEADLNRAPDGKNDAALQEYRETIQELLKYTGVLSEGHHQITHPYLHLSIHGMRDSHHGPYALEVGTCNGQSCSAEVKEWMQQTLAEKAKEKLPKAIIIFDQIFDGDESLVFHRFGDGNMHKGYGPRFHTFQIEISRTLREHYLVETTALLSEVMLAFQKKFGEK